MKKHLLIIEDCETMQRFLTAYLQKNYAITSVLNQHEAKCLLKASNPFDIILLDINLPDGSGLHFIKEMKLDAKFQTPIVAMSGAKNISTRLDALETGATDFIEKPFLPREMAIRVKNALATHSMNKVAAKQNVFENVPSFLFAN